MASASIRYFVTDTEAVKDADADQCKRTFSGKLWYLQHSCVRDTKFTTKTTIW